MNTLKEYQIILAGGYYLSEEKSFYGHLTLDMILSKSLRIVSNDT